MTLLDNEQLDDLQLNNLFLVQKKDGFRFGVDASIYDLDCDEFGIKVTANGKTKLYIFSCCTNLIQEFKTYRWNGYDAPIKKDDH